MKNYEKFAEEIIEAITGNGSYLALTKGKLALCDETPCGECDFDKREDHCGPCAKSWLLSEYEEKPKLTQREWHLCKALKAGWIARDSTDVLFIYRTKPTKGNSMWVNGGRPVEIHKFMPGIFKFIQWQDAKPWSVEDLLALEVEE